MKAATLILVFEMVNGHRTLSGLTSPRPTVKEGEKRGRKGMRLGVQGPK